jgi:type IX secretion system substrate protein
MKTHITTLVIVYSLLAYNSSRSSAQAFSWAKNCDDSGKFVSSKVAVDANGNTYAAGFFTGTVTIGTATLVSAGGSDYCLIKYDSSGNIAWVRSGGGNGPDAGNDVHVDAAGNIYVTGFFHSSVDFGSTSLSNTDTDFASENLFVAKYDATGAPLWARQSVGNCRVASSNIFSDAANNVYVAGQFSDSLKLESTPLFGSSQSFVAKYDLNGNLQWARQSKGTGASGAHGVCADANGNVYTTGFVDSKDTFGTVVLTSAWALDVFLVKYDASGTVVWGRSAGGAGPTDLNQGHAVCTDAAGNIYITGVVQGTVDLGTVTLTGNGSPCFFIARFDTSGNAVWAKSPTGSANMASKGYGLAIDRNDNLYATGEFLGTIAFDAIPSITCIGGVHGSFDVFVTKFSSAGSAAWSVAAGGAGDDAGNSVGVNAGVISITGGYAGMANFGSFAVNNATSGSGSFVARIADTSGSTANTGISTPGGTQGVIYVYPNPASQTLFVNRPDAAMPGHYTIYSIAGQEIKEGAFMHDIDISALPNGDYLVNITSQNMQQTQKITVIKN